MAMRARHTARYVILALLTLVACALAASWVMGRMSGEFDLSQHRVPLEQIVSGGPGKDGIPALLNPRFVTAAEARYLNPEDRILGLSRSGEAKAYPIRILNWHEIVNDSVGGRQVVITYCPLCGTGIAFDARVDDRVHTFGVSGLLYQSDLVMYDHQTESLWSQVSMEAITGPLAGRKLTPVYLVHTTWEDWKSQHPETLVVSKDTGYRRDYSQDPYGDYAQRRDLMFDVSNFDPTYHPKAWVVGVEVDGNFKAYAFSELEKLDGPLADHVNGRPIRIHFNKDAGSAAVTDGTGKSLPSVMAFWFAWYAFHPDTEVFTAPK